MRRWALVLVAVLLLAGLAAGGAATVRWWALEQRAQPSGEPVVVEIPKGVGLKAAARLLADKGLVGSPLVFEIAARLSAGGPIQAGEYELSPAMSNRRILGMLRLGKVLLHSILIPEGYTMRQTAHRLAATKVADLGPSVDLLRRPSFIAAQGLDDATLEGYLFPETYLFPKGLGARTAYSIMIRRFWEAWRPLKAAAKARKMTRRQVVTLASIIEAEAKLPHEQPLISAVYHNRLRRGMLLQADPTVLYGLGGLEALGHPLYRSDLEVDTPYNTYLHKGLPPGPICSPGKGSLHAAVHPAKVKYLYFVAKGDGSHIFSNTYAQHLRAIRRFRR